MYLKSVYSVFCLILIISSIVQTESFAEQNPKSVSKILAEFTIHTETSEISDEAFEKAKMVIIDILGNTLAGYDAPGIPIIRSQMEEWGGKPEASVWFSGIKLPLMNSGFVNSSMAHALDLDDAHRPTNSHPSIVTVPTALVVGEFMEASGQEILDAIVIGTEITNSIGVEFGKFKKHGAFLPSSMVAGFGATAIACRLMGLSISETVNAFGIFYSHASGNRQALFDHSLTKRIQPAIAVKAAIFSASLAKEGFTGPEDIFLSNAGLFRIYGGNFETSLPQASEFIKKTESWAIEEIGFKMYAACGASHPVIEGAINLSKKYNLTLDEVKSIELFGIFVGSGYVDNPWKETDNPHVLAQFSAPYQVVSAIKNHKFGPDEITEKRILEDIEVSELAKKVIIKHQNEWGENYPGGHTIRIKTKDNRILVASHTPPEIFAPDRFTMNDIIEKFMNNAQFSELLSEEQSKKIVNAVQNIQEYNRIEEFIVDLLIFQPNK
jgi:2-methylcitrate dehydratase PrpD